MMGFGDAGDSSGPSGRDYGAPVDMYSLGNVFCHMVSGKRPWGHIPSNMQVVFASTYSNAYPVFHVIAHSLFKPLSYRTGVK